jgi:hypothetical protein
MKIRGTATDRLNDVIQSLQLVRRSGLLTVERDGPGNSSELGTIVFREGRVIDANVGQLRGADAFRVLSSWTTCRFLFEASPSPSISSSTAPLPAIRPNYQMTGRRYEESPANVSRFPVVVPYRSQYMQGSVPDFQQAGLSRIHRQLFLLIDGKRSSQEMARIMGRQPQEVLAMLADLERAGFIGQ